MENIEFLLSIQLKQTSSRSRSVEQHHDQFYLANHFKSLHTLPSVTNTTLFVLEHYPLKGNPANLKYDIHWQPLRLRVYLLYIVTPSTREFSDTHGRRSPYFPAEVSWAELFRGSVIVFPGVLRKRIPETRVTL